MEEPLEKSKIFPEPWKGPRIEFLDPKFVHCSGALLGRYIDSVMIYEYICIPNEKEMELMRENRSSCCLIH